MLRKKEPMNQDSEGRRRVRWMCVGWKRRRRRESRVKRVKRRRVRRNVIRPMVWRPSTVMYQCNVRFELDDMGNEMEVEIARMCRGVCLY
jgi:hypothetical protein